MFTSCCFCCYSFNLSIIRNILSMFTFQEHPRLINFWDYAGFVVVVIIITSIQTLPKQYLPSQYRVGVRLCAHHLPQNSLVELYWICCWFSRFFSPKKSVFLCIDCISSLKMRVDYYLSSICVFVGSFLASSLCSALIVGSLCLHHYFFLFLFSFLFKFVSTSLLLILFHFIWRNLI